MRGRQTRGKKREKKREWGSGPLVHTFLLAIEPFVCISPHLFSEKPPPRGCRHCWPNHVKYCLDGCVFSPQISLFRGSILNPKNYATQLAPFVGTDTASLGLSGGYHRVDRLPIYRTPERSSPLELACAAIRRSKLRQESSTRNRPNGLRNPLLRASNRAVDTTIRILITRFEERPHRSCHAPVEAPAVLSRANTCPACASAC